MRILETTIPDRAIWEDAVRRALEDAGLDDIPDDFESLLAFVRAHLVYLLDDEERPWLVSSVLEDLEAEAEVFRLGPEAASSARMAVATRIPDKLGSTERAPSDLSISMPEAPMLPRMQPPPADLVAEAARLATRPAKRKVDRPAVVLVDSDRFGRAAFARALVQGRCDVTVLDGKNEALAVFDGPDAIDAVVIDVDSPGAAAILEALVAARPFVPVVAWTKAPQPVAEHVARVAGVKTCVLLARNARPAEINEAIRRAVDEP